MLYEIISGTNLIEIFLAGGKDFFEDRQKWGWGEMRRN